MLFICKAAHTYKIFSLKTFWQNLLQDLFWYMTRLQWFMANGVYPLVCSLFIVTYYEKTCRQPTKWPHYAN